MSPRASDGTVTLPVGNPVVAGTAISADVQNATVADLASMIEDSLSRSGKGGMNTAMQFVKSISATPSITFVGDTDTGINSDTGGEVDIVANGTAALTVASTGVTIPGTLAVTGASTLTGLVTAEAGIDCNAQKIIDVLDPTADQDAATKKYVDDSVSGVLLPVEWTQPTAGVNCVTNALRTRKLQDGTVEFNGRITFTGVVADGVDILTTGHPPWSISATGYTSFTIMVPVYNSVGPTYAEVPVTFSVNGGNLRMFLTIAPYFMSATAVMEMTGITYYSA